MLGLQALEEESLELSPLDEGLIIHRTLQRFWENHTEGPLPEIPEGQREVERLRGSISRVRALTVPNRLLKDLRRFIRKDLNLLAWAGAQLLGEAFSRADDSPPCRWRRVSGGT